MSLVTNWLVEPSAVPTDPSIKKQNPKKKLFYPLVTRGGSTPRGVPTHVTMDSVWPSSHMMMTGHASVYSPSATGIMPPLPPERRDIPVGSVHYGCVVHPETPLQPVHGAAACPRLPHATMLPGVLLGMQMPVTRTPSSVPSISFPPTVGMQTQETQLTVEMHRHLLMVLQQQTHLLQHEQVRTLQRQLDVMSIQQHRGNNMTSNVHLPTSTLRADSTRLWLTGTRTPAETTRRACHVDGLSPYNKTRTMKVLECLCRRWRHRTTADWPEDLIECGPISAVVEAISRSPTRSLTVPQIVSAIRESTGEIINGKTLDMLALRAYVLCFPDTFRVSSGRTVENRYLDVVELCTRGGDASKVGPHVLSDPSTTDAGKDTDSTPCTPGVRLIGDFVGTDDCVESPTCRQRVCGCSSVQAGHEDMESSPRNDPRTREYVRRHDLHNIFLDAVVHAMESGARNPVEFVGSEMARFASFCETMPALQTDMNDGVSCMIEGQLPA